MKSIIANKRAFLFIGIAVLLAMALPCCATTGAALQPLPTPESLPAPEAVEFEVWSAEIPMGDGAKLAADIYLPGRDEEVPVILIMTPYNKKWYKVSLVQAMQENQPVNAFFPTSDYAVVTVDWRGKFDSADARPAVRADGPGMDGYDVVEWIAEQPWCNGKVAMWGQSALGVIQYHTVNKKPPHLVAIMPWVADYTNNYDKYYHGGVLRKEWMDAYDRIGWGALGKVIRAHPFDDGFYDGKDYAYPEEIEVPVLVVGGWFDLHDSTEVFNSLKADANEKVKEYHRVIIGPWTHTGAGKDMLQGELEFPGSDLFMKNEQKRFFDCWLRDIDNGARNAPAVMYYQLGENKWWASDTWPPEGVKETQFYLQADGLLSEVETGANSEPEHFISDPANPVPTVGGNNLPRRGLVIGPADQRGKVKGHEDVLFYTSDVLEEDLAITGNLKVILYVSSDCEDTDAAIRVTDVYPDGRSILLSNSIQRLSLMESESEENFIVPGQVYLVTIETHAIAATFLKGHRIRLIVASSNYPHYALNTNTLDKDGPAKVATNKLYHDADHLSVLILPVLNR